MELKKDLARVDETMDSYYLGEKIFANSNEDLNFIFSGVDFKDKEVLSVLASSDPVFGAYYLGAKNVDSFDKNPLTEYYYYLRKWFLEQKNEIVVMGHSDDDIKEVLKRVEIKNDKEKKALAFWKLVLRKNKDIALRANSLFYMSIPVSLPFKDIEKLKSKVLDKELKFRELDLFRPVEIEKKYDIVYISNILDYIFCKKEKLEITKNNLKKMVKDDGVIICSVFNRGFPDYPDDREKEVFEEDFELGKHFVGTYERPVYYTYKRR